MKFVFLILAFVCFVLGYFDVALHNVVDLGFAFLTLGIMLPAEFKFPTIGL